MAKHSTYDLDMGQLEVMWNFLKFGAQRPNVPALKDLCEQLRQAMVQKTAGQCKDDPEWYDSDDYGEDDYRKSVAKFKAKWFEQSREERLKNYIDEAVDELRKDLYMMIGGGKDA